MIFILVLISLCSCSSGKTTTISSPSSIEERILKFTKKTDYPYEGLYFVSGYYGSPTSVAIPDQYNNVSVGGVFYNAFKDCSSLKNVTFPSHSVYIEGMSFTNCTGLTTVNIPGGISGFDELPFEGCTSLTSINLGRNSYWYSSDGLIMSDGAVNELEYCPPGRTGTLTIPDGTKWIYHTAAYRCTKITNVSFPSSVNSIEYQAFGGCVSLTSVFIPKTITHIGVNAFMGCKNLTLKMEATSEPDSFESGWNTDCTVVWGATK